MATIKQDNCAKKVNSGKKECACQKTCGCRKCSGIGCGVTDLCICYGCDLCVPCEHNKILTGNSGTSDYIE